MSVIVDAGLFYALQNERAERHETARRALVTVYGGAFGTPFTSDYIYDEVVTLVRSRINSYTEARTVGDRILGRGEYAAHTELVYVTNAVFEAAVEIFDRYHDHPLSFTDATTIALMEEHAIDHLLSFDDDFDGIVDRLVPGEL